MDPRTIGMLMGCAEHGIAAPALHIFEARGKRASADAGVIGRLIAKQASMVMKVSGRGHSAPAYHLHFISKQADWNPHAQDVVDTVVTTLRMLAPLEKRAFSNVMSGVNTAVKGVGYGSLGLGAGLGALYWLLSRHANQDASDIESMNRQVGYYDELGRELDDSMRRKYRYDRNAPQQQQPAAVQ